MNQADNMEHNNNAGHIHDMKTALTIAGSDPSGGAGIQADIKTMSANGVYAMSVITSLTAQNTMGVKDIYNIPPQFVEAQLKSVLSDIVPDAVKTGMPGEPETVKTIAQTLETYKIKNIVVDPVMVSTSGSTLTDDESLKNLCNYLLPLADIITPNLYEASILTGITIKNLDDMIRAAGMLNSAFGCSVLLKGGHFESPDKYSHDVLVINGDKDPVFLSSGRINNPNTHGTGCTLSSAIASGLARGMTLKDACRTAKLYVSNAIADHLDLGHGAGPLNHIFKDYPS